MWKQLILMGLLASTAFGAATPPRAMTHVITEGVGTGTNVGIRGIEHTNNQVQIVDKDGNVLLALKPLFSESSKSFWKDSARRLQNPPRGQHETTNSGQVKTDFFHDSTMLWPSAPTASTLPPAGFPKTLEKTKVQARSPKVQAKWKMQIQDADQMEESMEYLKPGGKTHKCKIKQAQWDKHVKRYDGITHSSPPLRRDSAEIGSRTQTRVHKQNERAKPWVSRAKRRRDKKKARREAKAKALEECEKNVADSPKPSDAPESKPNEQDIKNDLDLDDATALSVAEKAKRDKEEQDNLRSKIEREMKLEAKKARRIGRKNRRKKMPISKARKARQARRNARMKRDCKQGDGRRRHKGRRQIIQQPTTKGRRRGL